MEEEEAEADDKGLGLVSICEKMYFTGELIAAVLSLGQQSDFGPRPCEWHEFSKVHTLIGIVYHKIVCQHLPQVFEFTDCQEIHGKSTLYRGSSWKWILFWYRSYWMEFSRVASCSQESKTKQRSHEFSISHVKISNSANQWIVKNFNLLPNCLTLDRMSGTTELLGELHVRDLSFIKKRSIHRMSVLQYGVKEKATGIIWILSSSGEKPGIMFMENVGEICIYIYIEVPLQLSWSFSEGTSNMTPNWISGSWWETETKRTSSQTGFWYAIVSKQNHTRRSKTLRQLVNLLCSFTCQKWIQDSTIPSQLG